MIESARRQLRQRLGSPGVWISLAVLAVLSGFSIGNGQPASFLTTLAVFVIAGGIVSRDAASGALQLILTRPILRGEYLFGRFLGALVLLAGFVTAALGITYSMDRVASLAGWSSGGPLMDWGAAAAATLHDFLAGTLSVAIVLLFSTFLRGIGDVLAYILCGLGLNLLPQLFDTMRKPSLAAGARTLLENVAPNVAWMEIAHGDRFLQAPTGRYFLAVAVYLLAAALIFNRREFSYGAD